MFKSVVVFLTGFARSRLELLLQRGGVSLLTNLLARYSSSGAVAAVADGLGALRQLLQSPDACSAVATTQGCIAAVLAVISAHVGDETVAQHGEQFLWSC